MESDNLDLLERVQVLEEQLEKEHAAKLARATTPCVNTVAAKDQYITKLEKETKAVQEEITKLVGICYQKHTNVITVVCIFVLIITRSGETIFTYQLQYVKRLS